MVSEVGDIRINRYENWSFMVISDQLKKFMDQQMEKALIVKLIGKIIDIRCFITRSKTQRIHFTYEYDVEKALNEGPAGAEAKRGLPWAVMKNENVVQVPKHPRVQRLELKKDKIFDMEHIDLRSDRPPDRFKPIP
ncbi:hypothetical protein Sjap_010616 [Stephania japonica]|uniref:Uncharacterized protein n=1 Tax=Stephania japonica TaxID=461633 RepID=A0AAP0J9X2_9MAGN